jgi:hypothetical protein
MQRFLLSPLRNAFLVAILGIGVHCALGQTTFERTYNGALGLSGHAVQQTSDGGYIVAGTIFRDDYDMYLIKTTASGDTLWTRVLLDSGVDDGRDVQQTSDGGYIIAGSDGGSPMGGPSHMCLVKTDPTGGTVWRRTYGQSWIAFGYAAQQTSGGGYVIAGSAQPEGAFLVKTNSSGDTIWTKTYGPKFYDAKSVQQTTDDGYIIAGGYTANVYLIKTDSSGDTLWTRTYGQGSGYSVQQTSDDGYIFTGSTFLIRTDSSGNTLWRKPYGGVSVQQTSDGGFIVAGGDSLTRTDAFGDALWTRAFSGRLCSVRQTGDGGYVAVGSTGSYYGREPGIYLVKTDANGLVDIPLPPMLVVPLDGATDQSTTLTLLWKATAGAAHYRLQVGIDSTFHRGLFLDDSTLTDTSLTASGLEMGTRYFWRVNATGLRGTSIYSSVWTFETKRELPAPVTLAVPEDGATTGKDSVRFFWRASWPDVQLYKWELAMDSLFRNPVIDSLLTDTLKVAHALTGGQTYWWKVAAKNAAGWGPFSIARRFTTLLTGISQTEDIPRKFGLEQNYPNPFNPKTGVRFQVGQTLGPAGGGTGVAGVSDVKLVVYDLLGREVAVLVNDRKQPGNYEVSFDASALASGIYFYRLTAGLFVQSRTMILLK